MVRRPAGASDQGLPAAVRRLGRAIGFQTVTSGPDQPPDPRRLSAFHAFLETAYPRVHRSLSLRTLGDYARLYEWPGRQLRLPPVLFNAHADVVPAGPEARWTLPPFGGAVRGGYVWGRGALDMKCALIGLLEAMEELLRQGFVPTRTVYLAIGADEESTGRRGAALIARHLRSQRIRPECIFDEGGFIVSEMVPGVKPPVALIGTAEKGCADLELLAGAAGGHASMPPRHTAAGLLSRAVCRLEARPLPARLTEPLRQFARGLAPHLRGVRRLLFGHPRLFGGLLASALTAQPGTAALVRTTRAVTILASGEKENVLPRRARAVVNTRILPGDSVAGVLERTRRLCGPLGVEVRLLEGAGEPVPAASVRCPGYRALRSALAEVFPQAVAVPYLTIAATDSRHYRGLGADIYRFLPLLLEQKDLQRIHGIDERVSVEGFLKLIHFYRTLIRLRAGEEEA
jgi:carboxypeptidase PM20D1